MRLLRVYSSAHTDTGISLKTSKMKPVDIKLKIISESKTTPIDSPSLVDVN